ncbi:MULTISPECIES: hypothetical protein [Kitasatospora]|uniref:Uncharacterized protein n=1 Tax=Kitasatospora cathayae TaxID=3004092 RepID=A0ABY7Q0U2_9ACTN|nr:hypothetical protein [Kitasatospora sp. HUAS 3-15]WBP86281.1 hypothetical protein O1G21_10795 [Kitasatospora sp. HUAS 3-15]
MSDPSPGAHEQAAEIRKARFGALPERVPFEDMVEEKAVLPAYQAVDAYDPDALAVRFSCLAADLGL